MVLHYAECRACVPGVRDFCYSGQSNAPRSLTRRTVFVDARANLIAAKGIDYASTCRHVSVRHRAELCGLLQ